jgi:long-chain acyl-CoA synthetase
MSDRVLGPVLNRIVLGPLRRQFIGDSVRILFTGSAPMAPEIMEFFHAIGLPLLEGYAMSENIVPMAMNRLHQFRIGAVGLPLSLNEIRIDEENELQVKGPGVFSGYYKSDAADDRFTADGFFKTGDSGRMDSEGFLWLTGRTSEILKTSTGRRISPLAIEAALRSSPYIDQAVVFGHGRRHLAALITIQTERIERQLAAAGLTFESREALATSPAAHALLQPEVDRVTKPFPAYEQVRVFAIAPRPFDIASGELTSSLKLRRNIIERNYAKLLEPLFAGEAAGS